MLITLGEGGDKNKGTDYWPLIRIFLLQYNVNLSYLKLLILFSLEEFLL